MNEPAIAVADLGRHYHGSWAVRHLTLQVAAGELYGFLGQNGAGKTTTIRMLAGLLQPSEGTLRLGGLDYARHGRELRARVGLVPDTPPLYDYLTGRQYVALVASLWRVERRQRDARCERLFDLLQLDGVADELCKGYSHGTRKKMHLAAVLTTAPQILLLDEPTTGLDPLSVRRLKDLLRDEAARGAAVLLSTHVLETAEQICHRVGILAAGALRAEGTAEQLRSAHGGASLEDVFLHLTDTRGKDAPDGPAAR
jgi:ABC-2 type transport system ATP-binding protein